MRGRWGHRRSDRLAELVRARLMLRGPLGKPLLSAAAAGELVGVSAETVRRAIRSGALPAAGYLGARPRVHPQPRLTNVVSGLDGTVVSAPAAGVVADDGAGAA